MVALHGLGGTGKTTVALAHAYACLDDAAVSDAWQFPAWDDTMLQASFSQLATVLGVTRQRQRPSAVHAVHSVLADREKPWLLVFDNAHDYGSLSGYLPPAGNGQVVITSQNAVSWPHGLGIGIPVLDTASAARFLVERTDDPDQAAAEALAAELGGLPLALEQARAYIQATGFDLAGYLAAVRMHPDLLGRGRVAGYDKTVATTWTLAFKAVEQNSPVAAGLLRLLACCAPEPVPLQLLLHPPRGMEDPFGPGVAPLLQALLGDPLTALEAVAELQNFSLLSLLGPARDRLVQVHRLVRTVTALDMRRDNPALAEQWHQAAVTLVEAAVPARVSSPQAWPACSQLLPHALKVLPAGSDGLSRIANYLGETGSSPAARNLQRDIAEARARQFTPADPRTLSARHDLAFWTGQAGDPATARDQLAALLPLERETLGESHPQVLATRHNLASLTGETGDPATARDEFAALLTLHARLSGPDQPATLAARHELARWTGEAGEPAAARDQFQALLPEVRRVHGDDDPRTIAARHELARWTGEAGDPRAASRQLNAIIREEEQARGPEHPWVLTARHEAAIWTGLAGDPQAAHQLLAELLPACRRAYGPDHPDTVAVANDTALWAERAAEAGTGQEPSPAAPATGPATAAAPPGARADRAPARQDDSRPGTGGPPAADDRPVRVSRGFTRNPVGQRLPRLAAAAAAVCVVTGLAIAATLQTGATHGIALPTVTASAVARPTESATPTPPPATLPAGVIVTSTDYSTPEPFPLCDPAGARWLLVNANPQPGGCGPNMQADSVSPGYGFGTLTSLPGAIPLTARNTITVSGQISAHGGLNCLGLAEGSTTHGYITLLCNNGHWYVNSVANLGTTSVTVGKQLATGSYPYDRSATYDISLTFGPGTGKLKATFPQGTANPLSEAFSAAHFTPTAVGYALNSQDGNGNSIATIGRFTYTVG